MRVRFYASLRDLTGTHSVEIPLRDGTTIREILDELVERWPALRGHLFDAGGGLTRRVQVCVNGRSVRFRDGGLCGRLTPADEIDVFPPVAGGRAREPRPAGLCQAGASWGMDGCGTACPAGE